MEYILITLSRQGKDEDLKVPDFTPAGELLSAFCEIYGGEWKVLHAEPKGIILDKSKTLAEQGIEHGARLTLS